MGTTSSSESGLHNTSWSDETVADEAAFWGEWYKRTRDWSVGPAVTIYNDPQMNAHNQQRTKAVLADALQRASGQYRLPQMRA